MLIVCTPSLSVAVVVVRFDETTSLIENNTVLGKVVISKKLNKI